MNLSGTSAEISHYDRYGIIGLPIPACFIVFQRAEILFVCMKILNTGLL